MLTPISNTLGINSKLAQVLGRTKFFEDSIMKCNLIDMK